MEYDVLIRYELQVNSTYLPHSILRKNSDVFASSLCISEFLYVLYKDATGLGGSACIDD